MSSRARLEHALQALRELPFPEGSTDAVVDDLHAELAEFDGHINGLAARLLGGERFTLELSENRELRASLMHAQREGTPGARADATRQLHYLDALDLVVRAAREFGAPKSVLRGREPGGAA